MTISLEHLYLDFALPRRLLGLLSRGEGTRDEAIRTLVFCAV